MAVSIGNSTLGLLIRKIVDNNLYPSEFDVSRMRTSLIEGGMPPFNIREVISRYVTPINEGDIRCETPPGYPANLPAPYYLPDKRIVLKPVPVSYELSNVDVAWIMVALQNAVNLYSKHPYPVNWEVAGKGSGFGRIVECAQRDDSPENFVMWKFHNFAVQPDVGGDPLGKMLLGTVLSFIPFGGIIGNTLGLLSTMQPGSGATNLPPPPAGSGSGNTYPGEEETGSDGTMNYTPWLIGAAVMAALLYWYYEGDT